MMPTTPSSVTTRVMATRLNVGISFGAPKSLSNYIGNAGDGKKWLERLTSDLKMFTVPVAIPSVAPRHASDPCVAGTETWDSNFIYICVAKNTWKRAPLAVMVRIFRCHPERRVEGPL